jgi:hypothetical protein
LWQQPLFLLYAALSFLLSNLRDEFDTPSSRENSGTLNIDYRTTKLAYFFRGSGLAKGPGVSVHGPMAMMISFSGFRRLTAWGRFFHITLVMTPSPPSQSVGTIPCYLDKAFG